MLVENKTRLEIEDGSKEDRVRQVKLLHLGEGEGGGANPCPFIPFINFW